MAPPGTIGPLTPASFADLAQRVDESAAWSRGHSRRVARMSVAIAAKLGWAAEEIGALHVAAELHDVGKLCVAASVLGRPGPLLPWERAEVEMHPVLGALMLGSVLDPEPVLWVRHHHERWDGAGYPDGLRGDAIPAGACIIAVAEAWDAMTAPGRPDRLSAESARREILRTKGQQFAPWAADGLLTVGSGEDSAEIP